MDVFWNIVASNALIVTLMAITHGLMAGPAIAPRVTGRAKASELISRIPLLRRTCPAAAYPNLIVRREAECEQAGAE